MRRETYHYSSELAEPEGSIDCNRKNPVIWLREMRSIQHAKKEVKKYAPPEGIRVETITYPSRDMTEILCYVVKPERPQNHSGACMAYYHGGGFMLPLQKMMLCNAAYYAAHTGCTVFLPEYRYAPKVRCKTTLEDCFSLITHLRKYEQDYRIDMKKLIIYGDSAGAALAAGVTHLMRDRRMPAAAGQMLIYPALDFHSERYASVEAYRDAVWPKKSNDYMWKLYLKGADAETKKLAAPMNMDSFAGLPPAYVEPQEMDILCDEGIAYAKKLKEQGSLAELNVVMGSYHGFDCDHESPLVQRILTHRCEIMMDLFSKGDGKS